jgi:hypothetical protein
LIQPFKIYRSPVAHLRVGMARQLRNNATRFSAYLEFVNDFRALASEPVYIPPPNATYR